MKLYLKNHSQKSAGGVTQGIGPEFKSQYHKKKEFSLATSNNINKCVYYIEEKFES
jgi:hypothetical protein